MNYDRKALKKKLAKKETKNLPDLAKILSKTQPQHPNFQKYLSDIIIAKRTAALSLPKKYNFTSFKRLFKLLLIYTDGIILNAALKCFNDEHTKALCVYTIDPLDLSNNNETGTRKHTKEDIKILTFIETKKSTEKVFLDFQDGLISIAYCSCSYKDIFWCEHIVLSILFLHEEAFFKLRKEIHDKEDNLAKWPVFADFELNVEEAIKMLKKTKSGKLRQRYLEYRKFKDLFGETEKLNIDLRTIIMGNIDLQNFLKNNTAFYEQNAMFEECFKCKSVWDIFTEALDNIFETEKNGEKEKFSVFNKSSPFELGFSDTLFCLKKREKVKTIEKSKKEDEFKPNEKEMNEKKANSEKSFSKEKLMSETEVIDIDEFIEEEKKKSDQCKDVFAKADINEIECFKVSNSASFVAEKCILKLVHVFTIYKENRGKHKEQNDRSELKSSSSKKKRKAVSEKGSEGNFTKVSKKDKTDLENKNKENLDEASQKALGEEMIIMNDENKSNEMNNGNSEMDRNDEERIGKKHFIEMIKRSAENDFGFSNDCCGCHCHKIAKKWDISEKEVKCKICAKYHNSECFVFRFILSVIFKKINLHTKLCLKNYCETQNALFIFEKVSRFFFFIKDEMEKYELLTKTVKKEITALVSSIFTNLFLSFNIDIHNYVDLLFLYKSWKQVLDFQGIPEEGWFGKKIERIFNKEIFEIEEDPKNSKERIACLISEGRFVDALIYSCAVKEYFYASKCLGHIGRIDESVEILNSIYLSQRDALEFAKVYCKKDKKKAFDFYATYLQKRKSLKSDKELDWLIKISEKDNERNEMIENLVHNIPSIGTTRLKELILLLFESGLKESAFCIMLGKFFCDERKLDVDVLDWVFEIVISRGKERAGVFVDKLIEVMHYHFKLSGDMTQITEKLAKANLFNEAFKIGIRFMELYVAHFKKESSTKSNIILNSFIKEDNRNFISSLVVYLFEAIGTCDNTKEKKRRIESFIKTVFGLKNVEFLFEILKSVSSRIEKTEMDNNLSIEYGKTLFILQFSFSRKDPLVGNILKWLLSIALENEHRNVPKENFSADLIKSEEDHKMDTFETLDKMEKVENIENSKENNTRDLSVKSIIEFARENLKKYAGAYSQHPLLYIADFMFERKVGSLEDILEVALAALKIDFRTDGEVERAACKYYEIAAQSSEKKAREIARAILTSNPNLINFNRLASLYAESGMEWLDLREEILEKITHSDNFRYEENSASKSSEILRILLQEEAPLEDVCGFLKQECCNYKNPEKALELLKFLLNTQNSVKKGEELISNEDFWFCGVHFNIIVATLKGVSVDAKKEFIRFVEKVYPPLVVKTAITFSQALTLLIEKNVKFVVEKKVDKFFNLLEESRYMFEKALKRKEWEMLIENIGAVVNEGWFKTRLERWKTSNSFATPMILIE